MLDGCELLSNQGIFPIMVLLPGGKKRHVVQSAFKYLGLGGRASLCVQGGGEVRESGTEMATEQISQGAWLQSHCELEI